MKCMLVKRIAVCVHACVRADLNMPFTWAWLIEDRPKEMQLSLKWQHEAERICTFLPSWKLHQRNEFVLITLSVGVILTLSFFIPLHPPHHPLPLSTVSPLRLRRWNVFVCVLSLQLHQQQHVRKHWGSATCFIRPLLASQGMSPLPPSCAGREISVDRTPVIS